MATIDLSYGRASIPLEFDAPRFDILRGATEPAPLTDAEIGDRLDSPIDSPPLDELVRATDSVLLVVPDATRRSGAGQVVNLLTRRLITNGTPPGDIAAIFATGIHRPVSEREKEDILTPFVARRIRSFDHNAYDALKNFRIGEISNDIPIELNWMLTEFDRIVLVGGIVFHYFAGFTGGRKLICPGLASARTIEATHKLAFDCQAMDRRAGVGTGLLDGNAVHEAFVAGAVMISPAFAINTIVNDAGEITDLFCGDWISSHRKACDEYSARQTIVIAKKRELVIASCGGYPHDINLIQAHKALEAAAAACVDGGTIVLLGECGEGPGRDDFMAWFEAEDSFALAEKLCGNYRVNGQTAWSLLRKAERFRIKMLTSLPGEAVHRLRIEKVESLEDAMANMGRDALGYILPSGASLRVIQQL